MHSILFFSLLHIYPSTSLRICMLNRIGCVIDVCLCVLFSLRVSLCLLREHFLSFVNEGFLTITIRYLVDL